MEYPGQAVSVVTATIALWFGMLICLEIGRRIGVRQLRRRGTESRAGVGVIDGAVYAMLSFLIGFSFSGAAGRLDHRRQLVATEVNAIGTAWDRIALLAADQQADLRPRFRRYVDLLIASYSDSARTSDVLLEPPALSQAKDDVWSTTIAACLTQRGEPARVLLIPSMNEMFGSIETERLARRIHPPGAIFVILAVMALLSSLFGGYAIAAAPTRSWLYMIGLSTTISLAMWATLELEYPRLGLIRVESMDRALVELRASMK
jgi:hypothetical protein